MSACGSRWCGKCAPLRAFFSALRSESGEQDGGVTVLEGFTERKRAEENIDTQDSDAIIVETILAMAQLLGIAVVAEGVENEAQQAYLLARDCQLFQGFYYSRPLSGEAFEGLLAGLAQPTANP